MKSKKLLSALMALAIVATSSIALGTSVQASNVTNKSTNMQKTLASIPSNYSAFASLTNDAIQDIYQYDKSGSYSTATQLADYMVSKGYVNNKTDATNMALTIMLTGINSLRTENESANGVTFLKATDSNKYTIVPRDMRNIVYSYYYYLSSNDVNNVINYLNIKYSISGLTEFLINNKICDSSMARNLAVALCARGTDGLKHINVSGICILKTNETNPKYVACPVPVP